MLCVAHRAFAGARLRQRALGAAQSSLAADEQRRRSPFSQQSRHVACRSGRGDWKMRSLKARRSSRLLLTIVAVKNFCNL